MKVSRDMSVSPLCTDQCAKEVKRIQEAEKAAEVYKKCVETCRFLEVMIHFTRGAG